MGVVGEFLKPPPSVEPCGIVVLGVDEHGSATDFIGRRRTARECVPEKLATQPTALLGTFQSQTREKDHRYRPVAWKPGTEPPGSLYGFDRTRSKGVEPYDPRSPTQDVGDGGTGPLI